MSSSVIILVIQPSRLNKMLQTSDIFTFVRVVGHVPCWHFNNTCHIMFTSQPLWPDLHIGRWRGCWASLAGRLPNQWRQFKIVFQHLWVWNHWIFVFLLEFPALFVATKNPDLFNGKSGQFQAVFVKNRTGVFNKAFGRLQPFLWRPNQIIQAKTGSFPRP